MKGAKGILNNKKLKEISIEINENEKNKKNEIFKLLKENNFLFIQKKIIKILLRKISIKKHTIFF